MTNFIDIALKMWLYGPYKSPKMVILGKNLPLGKILGVDRKI